MYTSTVKRSHSRSHGLPCIDHLLILIRHVLMLIRHHFLMTILVLLVIVLIGYGLHAPVDTRSSAHVQESSIASAGPTHPLTLLDDPRYAHEYDARAQYIYDRLDTLRKQGGVPRTYMFSYAQGDPQTGRKYISHVFEVIEEGIMRTYPPLRRPMTAGHGDCSLTRVSLYSYTIKLSNEGMIIGCLGFEGMTNFTRFQDDQLRLLHRTARDMEAALLQPFEHLQGN